MANDNPILFIHDVGAGGLSNAIPELVHDISMGGNFELRDNDNAGCSSRSIFWLSHPLLFFAEVNKQSRRPLRRCVALVTS